MFTGNAPQLPKLIESRKKKRSALEDDQNNKWVASRPPQFIEKNENGKTFRSYDNLTFLLSEVSELDRKYDINLSEGPEVRDTSEQNLFKSLQSARNFSKGAKPASALQTRGYDDCLAQIMVVSESMRRLILHLLHEGRKTGLHSEILRNASTVLAKAVATEREALSDISYFKKEQNADKIVKKLVERRENLNFGKKNGEAHEVGHFQSLASRHDSRLKLEKKWHPVPRAENPRNKNPQQNNQTSRNAAPYKNKQQGQGYHTDQRRQNITPLPRPPHSHDFLGRRRGRGYQQRGRGRGRPRRY